MAQPKVMVKGIGAYPPGEKIALKDKVLMARPPSEKPLDINI